MPVREDGRVEAGAELASGKDRVTANRGCGGSDEQQVLMATGAVRVEDPQREAENVGDARRKTHASGQPDDRLVAPGPGEGGRADGGRPRPHLERGLERGAVRVEDPRPASERRGAEGEPDGWRSDEIDGAVEQTHAACLPRIGYGVTVDITGKTIMVTGASGGIGEAVARDLAAAGATVIAVARTADDLDRLADGVDGDVRPFPCDVIDPADRKRLFEDPVVSELDVVVNNAGAAWVGSFLDMDDDEIEHAIALNFSAVVAVCRAVVPGMQTRGGGHVVNIGSILGFAPGPPLTLYSSTKAAVHAFTEGLRREMTGTDVRVTLVAPGPVKDTGALDQPGDEGTTKTLERAFATFGTSAEAVAAAVRTALVRDARPSARTITVPRIAGLSRVASIPGADWAMDRGFELLRRAGVKV